MTSVEYIRQAYAQQNQQQSPISQTSQWEYWARQYLEYMKARQQQPKSIDLPDEFDTWVAEVRKQNRMEQLVQAVYDNVMAHKVNTEE